MFVNIILYIYYIVNFFVDILSELFQLLTLLHFLNILIRETKEIIKVEEAIVNKRIITLNKLELGKSATIISLLSRDDERRRMLDLGMLKGATIKAIQKSPGGDPTAYFVCGTLIALRSEDAEKCIVETV